MDLHEYFEQMELNREDPDYQIEEFWYGFKKAMMNFYKSTKIVRNIQLWSDKLNEYKKDKKYSLIEESIKEHITLYAIDVMENEEYDECSHSNILFDNIKRWSKISNKFHFGDSSKYKSIILLFGAFCCVKRKCDEKLYPILELFDDVRGMILTDYIHLFSLSLELGQNKMLDCLMSIVGQEKAFKLINEFCPDLTSARDKKISGRKLYKKYLTYKKTERN